MNRIARQPPSPLPPCCWRLAATHAADAPSPSAKPHIVFIFADDWGWGDLRATGIRTQDPNLDRLASDGIDFHQFNVLNPLFAKPYGRDDGAVPGPLERASTFRQRQQNQRGMPDWLNPRAPTLARILRGPATHRPFWEVAPDQRMVPNAPPPTAHGFDEFKVFNYSNPMRDSTTRRTTRWRSSAPTGPAVLRERRLHESHTPHVPTKESLAAWSRLGEQQRVCAAVITDGDNKSARCSTR